MPARNLSLVIFSLIFVSQATFSAPRNTVMLSDEQFDQLTVLKMNEQNVYLSHPTDKLEEFSDWVKNKPTEKNALVIYPDYTEPMLTSMKNGQRTQVQGRVVMFVTKAKLVLNKAPSEIEIKNFVNLAKLQQIDPEIEHIQIQPHQFIGNVVGKGPVENFKWGRCKDNILRPAREVDLKFTNPTGRGSWCSDPAQSICLESCYAFGAVWRQGVSLVNLAVDAAEQKDLGIGVQSELRYFSNETELGLKAPLSQLSRISTPVRSGIEQNMFYFNQVIQFGKVLAFIQDHPTDAKKSVATLYFAVAVNRRTYMKHDEIKNVLLGKSIFNTGTGLTAGLPVFTVSTINSIVNMLEK